MTQEKELLLKDLCARLPYGVICHYDTIVPMVGKVKSYDKLRAISEFDNKPCFQFNCNRDIFDFDNIKPYLFPLSSMTDDMMEELNVNGFFKYCDSITNVSHLKSNKGISEEIYTYIDIENISFLIEFFHSHYIDYRGLIERGLALDATGLNIY